MISAVNFGSTYKAYFTDTTMNSRKVVANYLNNNEIFYQERTEAKEVPLCDGVSTLQPRYSKKIGKGVMYSYTISSPNEYDKNVEAFLNNMGVDFRRVESEELEQKREIKKRIIPDKKGFTLVYISPKKLESIASTQESNIASSKDEYKANGKEKAREIINSGRRFYADTLYISYNNNINSPIMHSLKADVSKHGTKNLRPDTVSISLYQEEGDEDASMYFGLQDTGFRVVPVYMDTESLQNAEALKLLKQ